MKDEYETAVYGDRRIIVEAAEGVPCHVKRCLGYEDEPDLLTCDFCDCGASAIDDIIDGVSKELLPIYLDTKGEHMLCQRCVDRGRAEEETE